MVITIYQPNEIIVKKGKICEMILRDKECNIVGKTIFDIDFLEKIKERKWHLNSVGYVKSSGIRKKNTHKWKIRLLKLRNEIYLHHLIIGKREGFVVDHINRNPLDNRLCNLRHITKKQNEQNNNGIGIDKRGSKWLARICVNQKKIHLGSFESFEEAQKVRKQAERFYFKGIKQ